MLHPFMVKLATDLAARQIATLRYQFPYMEKGSRRPDPPALCHATVRAAVAAAHALVPALPLMAGGKSFGGRMTSQAQAAIPLPQVRGLAFLGFPLHPPKEPSDSRAEHLSKVDVPMLFLQGARDEFAGDIAAAAGPGLDHELLAENLAHALPQHARGNVGRRARDEADDQPYRLGRIVVSPRRGVRYGQPGGACRCRANREARVPDHDRRPPTLPAAKHVWRFLASVAHLTFLSVFAASPS